MLTVTVAEHYFVGTQIHIKETFLNWDLWRKSSQNSCFTFRKTRIETAKS